VTTEAYVIPTLHPAGLMRTGRPLTDVIRYDIAKAIKTSLWGHAQEEKLCVVLPSNPSGMAEAVHAAAGWMQRWKSLRCPVAVDVETSSISFWSCKLYSIALCGEDGNNCGVSWTLGDFITLPSDAQWYLDYHLRSILGDPAIPKTYHNAPFDKSVLTRKGFEIAGQTWDTQGLHHLVQPDIYHDLGWVGHTYLDVEPWKLNHEGKKMAFSRDVTELLVYNAKDAINTAKLRQPLLDEIYSKSMSSTLVSWQMAFSDLACRMELAGVPINQPLRRQIGQNLLSEIQGHLQSMRTMLNWPDFNPNKPTHAREAIYGRKYCGISPTQYTEKNNDPSTSYHAFIDHLEHPFILHFTKYIEKRSIYSTQYLDPGGTTFKGEISDRGGAYAQAIYPDGRLHCKWNCYDGETEVLTSRGFVPFPYAVAHIEELEFAQYNPGTELICFTAASNPVAGLSDELLDIESEQVSLGVTADHRLLLRERPGRKRRVSVVSAGDLEYNRRWVHAGRHEFKSKCEWSEDEARLLVAVQADGSWSSGGWRFNFNKQSKLRRLKSILDSLSLRYSERDLGPRSPPGYTCRYSVRINSCNLARKIFEAISEKRLWGPWLLRLSLAAVEAIVAELGHWDGSIECERIRYNTTVESNAMWVQVLACLTGKRAHVRPHEWQGGSGWRVNISRRIFSAVKPDVTPHKRSGTHAVYCVSVPTSFIIVRRRGKIVICGNSTGQKGSRFSSEPNLQNVPQYPVSHRVYMEAPPGRIIVGADKDQLELRLIAVRAGVEELLTEMRKPDGDPHTLAAINAHGAKFLTMPLEMRRLVRNMIKNVVYASIYMAGVRTVWHTIRERKQLPAEMRAACTLAEVSKICRSYFGRYTQIPEWHQNNYSRVEQCGYLEIPPLGRRRYFPVQPAPFKEIANWPIQTVGSDIVGMEMVQIDYELRRRFKDAFVILHGHDAVYTECYERDAEAVAQLIDSIFGKTYIDGPAGPVYLTSRAKIAKNLSMKPNLRKAA